MVYLGSVAKQTAAIKTYLGDRRVAATYPSGVRAKLPEFDHIEEMVEVRANRSAASLMLFIYYIDANGQKSQRRISVRQVQGHPPKMLSCYCHERRAMRLFRIDRIVEAVHPETGEILVGADIISTLLGAGFRPVDPLVRRIVTVLVFIMRCDGRADLEEWEVVDDAIDEWAAQYGGREQVSISRQLARQIAPDSGDMLSALRSLSKGPFSAQVGRFLNRSVQRIISVDGIEEREEFQWALELHNFFNRMEQT